MRKNTAAVVALAALALPLTGCFAAEEAALPTEAEVRDGVTEWVQDEFGSGAEADAAAGAGTIDTAATRATLDQLPVQPESDADYDRDRDYGDGWHSTGDGCDVRDAIMIRDMETYTLREDGCSVATGTLDDPYTGTTIDFEFGRAPGQSDAVQIEHLVALSEAHDSGAAEWTQDQREAYSNDPFVLLAVDGPANNAKGDQDAAEWLPDNGAYQCQYAASQVQIKDAYGLSVDQAEHDALRAVLDQC